MKTKRIGPQVITIGKKRAVVLEEREYRRLLEKADDGEPPLPPREANGTYPAREYLWVSIARTILRRRRALGWTQAELARRAGIRPKTLERLEQGNHAPSVSAVDKIDRVLEQAETTKDK
jgi:ribosome-binding protein aMBF1 (putative translation factor)